jgi:hypothetical protein
VTSVATPATLILAFNRPDKTRAVFDSVRAAKPRRLFVAVDGPRQGRAEDASNVLRVQSLANEVDWDCEVATLFRSANLGCKAAVSSAINWFFEHVDEGVILEDDCVPHPSFFRYAQELLQRYGHDQRIMTISGDNFQRGRRRGPYSYYFSRYSHIWGWATWRRAWRSYDHAMSAWPQVRDGGWLRDLFPGNPVAARYWARIFEETYRGKNDSWAYRWTFCCLANSGLTILPAVNLVSNIGFDVQATHTTAGANRLGGLPAEEMEFPLRHPPFVIRDTVADEFTQSSVFGTRSLRERAAGKLSAIFRLANAAQRH